MKFKAKASFARMIDNDENRCPIITMPFEVEAVDRAEAYDGVWEICNELGLTVFDIELFEEGDGFKRWEEK